MENSKQNLKDGSSLKGDGGRSKCSYSPAAALQAQVKNIRYHVRTVQSLTCSDKEGAFEKRKSVLYLLGKVTLSKGLQCKVLF